MEPNISLSFSSFFNSQRISGHKWAKKHREKQLKNHKHLWNDVTPNYGLGCKRILMSEKYYAAIARPNFHLHTSHIDKIVDRTIYTKDGKKEEVDVSTTIEGNLLRWIMDLQLQVLILATGYKIQEYFSPMKIFGKGGENVLQTWMEKHPRSYYGITYSPAPNLFALLGPSTVRLWLIELLPKINFPKLFSQALAHSSVIFMIECQVNFMIKSIREMMRRNVKVMNVKLSAENEFMDKLNADLKDTVWKKEDCGSWYVNARGDITTLWGDNCTNYWRQTKTIDWSKFEMK